MSQLKHFGVLGMRWGRHSKTGYRSTSVRSAIARKSNDITDAGFKEWDTNVKRKNSAIDAGKRRNEAKILYESNPSDKILKTGYKLADKEYKKALGKNTTYRKGVVKQEVGQDIARRYLSEAKKVKKQIDKGPIDPTLQKKYQKLMNNYDIERASARRAVQVSSKRSAKKASIKRGMTMTVKAAAGAAIIGIGATYANKKLAEQGREPLNTPNIIKAASTIKDLLGYF